MSQYIASYYCFLFNICWPLGNYRINVRKEGEISTTILIYQHIISGLFWNFYKLVAYFDILLISGWFWYIKGWSQDWEQLVKLDPVPHPEKIPLDAGVYIEAGRSFSSQTFYNQCVPLGVEVEFYYPGYSVLNLFCVCVFTDQFLKA